MVKTKWIFNVREKVIYLAVHIGLGEYAYYKFPKANINKRFHPSQIFTRSIPYTKYLYNLVPLICGNKGWVEDWLSDDIVRKKLELPIFKDEVDYYEQLSKAC